MLIINLLILIANFNYLIINLNVVRHNLGKNVTSTSKSFIYRMMNSTHPTNSGRIFTIAILRADLKLLHGWRVTMDE